MAHACPKHTEPVRRSPLSFTDPTLCYTGRVTHLAQSCVCQSAWYIPTYSGCRSTIAG